MSVGMAPRPVEFLVNRLPLLCLSLAAAPLADGASPLLWTEYAERATMIPRGAEAARRRRHSMQRVFISYSSGGEGYRALTLFHSPPSTVLLSSEGVTGAAVDPIVPANTEPEAAANA